MPFKLSLTLSLSAWLIAPPARTGIAKGAITDKTPAPPVSAATVPPTLAAFWISVDIPKFSSIKLL